MLAEEDIHSGYFAKDGVPGAALPTSGARARRGDVACLPDDEAMAAANQMH
jgi:hypothetical protein